MFLFNILLETSVRCELCGVSCLLLLGIGIVLSVGDCPLEIPTAASCCSSCRNRGGPLSVCAAIKGLLPKYSCSGAPMAVGASARGPPVSLKDIQTPEEAPQPPWGPPVARLLKITI